VANQSIDGPQSMVLKQFFEARGWQSDELIFRVWNRRSAPWLFGMQQRWVYNLIHWPLLTETFALEKHFSSAKDSNFIYHLIFFYNYIAWWLLHFYFQYLYKCKPSANSRSKEKKEARQKKRLKEKINSAAGIEPPSSVWHCVILCHEPYHFANVSLINN